MARRGKRAKKGKSYDQRVAVARQHLERQGSLDLLSKPAPVNFFGGWGACSSYDGANRSENRGSLPGENLDTSRDLDRMTRTQLVCKSRWFQKNSGFAERAVTGAADLIGFQIPQAMTRDEGWNDWAEEYFREKTCNPAVFDRAAKLNFKTWQEELWRTLFSDGDSGTVLGKSRRGDARILFYESHQIAGDPGEEEKLPESYHENDGVVVDRHGKPRYYRLTNGHGTDRDSRLVRASSLIHFCNRRRYNRSRGETALARAINHLHDITESNAATKAAIKAAGEYVWQVVQTTTSNPAVFPGMATERSVMVEPNGCPTTEEEASADAIRVNIADVVGVPQAIDQPQGKKLEMITDSRPHPNYLEFVNYLMRDISWGIGLAPEVLWMMSGLTGPGVRFVMKDLERWTKKRQDYATQALHRYWLHFWSCEFAKGVRRPNDDRWWKVAWLPMASLTIDEGRDGSLEMKRLESGAETLARSWGSRGVKWDEAMTQSDKEIRKAIGLAKDDYDWRHLRPTAANLVAPLTADA